jgi:hypothetical protein
VTGTLGGLGVTGIPATDDLQIDALTFSKAFDGAAVAGGTATLSFTIQNLSGISGVTGLSFSDDLDAVIPGLVASGLPSSDVCGPGSQLSGTSLLSLAGGNLLPGGSCTFDVVLQVPATAALGDFVNTTSDLFASGLSVAGPATATLMVEPPPTFSKAFVPDQIQPGAISTLSFTVDNVASSLSASNLSFTDNLPAGVVVADPSNAVTSCTGGTLTAVSGSGVISYVGGTVGAGGSCSLQVDVSGIASGVHVNLTSDLTSSSGSSGPASATLTVVGPPAFDKGFAPNPVVVGGDSTLTYTIDNGLNGVAVSDLAFSDPLPAEIRVAGTPNASTTCTGGTLTAVAGSGVIDYAGGTVVAGASCTVSVDVNSAVVGLHLSTSGDLTSSAGNSGPASDILVVFPVGAGIRELPPLDLDVTATADELLEILCLWLRPDFAAKLGCDLAP